MVSAKRVFQLVFLMLCFASIPSIPSSASDLTEALKLRDIAQVRSLLAGGANANEVVRRDYPLNIAATYGPAEMVAILLEAGAGLEQPGRDGLYPLHNAVTMGHKDIVALLIKKGAVVDAKESKGRTPLVSFATTNGGDIEIARMLLAAGADPEIESAPDDDNSTALENAAYTGNLELAKVLIAAHANVNHRNLWGWSPLHLAVQHARFEIARLLIAHGADVNMANNMGKTPISLAPNDAAMKQLLIEAGAK